MLTSICSQRWSTDVATVAEAAVRLNEEVAAAKVIDGLSHTFMMFESSGKPSIYILGRFSGENASANNEFRWASQATVMEMQFYCGSSQLINCSNRSRIYSFHNSGCNFAYADGSVHFLSDDMQPQTFVSRFTIAGEEVVDVE